MGVRGKRRKGGHHPGMRQKSNKTNDWASNGETMGHRMGSFSEKQAAGLVIIAFKIIPKIVCGLFCFTYKSCELSGLETLR